MKNKIQLTPAEFLALKSPETIRQKCQQIYQLCESGRGLFRLDPSKEKSTVEFVYSVIKDNYPDLNIPFHSRWGHFRAGGLNRVSELDQLIQNVSLDEKARTKLDLVITSVLLDAGAGMKWNYKDQRREGLTLSKSEGLGVASFDLFLKGAFAEDGKSLKADQRGLSQVSEALIERGFQVTEENPLIGVSGRAQLLKKLGQALSNSKIFKDGRPGNLLDHLIETYGRRIPATGILEAVLTGLGSIWPGRDQFEIDGQEVFLGDCWSHSKLGEKFTPKSYVPFHKLSQWMTYSLIEPIQEANCEVFDVHQLTGLAEYRNGGLFLDSGWIQPVDPQSLQNSWEPSSEFVIEWRALTICLLDQVGVKIQNLIGKSPQEFPLAKVLEGGTWWAGRRLAKTKRQDGGPPFQILSDGTVF